MTPIESFLILVAGAFLPMLDTCLGGRSRVLPAMALACLIVGGVVLRRA